MHNNVPHGIGRFVNEQAEIWEGQFKEGKMHGYVRNIYNQHYYQTAKTDMNHLKYYRAFNPDGTISQERLINGREMIY